MSKNSNQARLLHEKICKILLKEWDPIGVRDVLEAQDEYDSYVSPIYELLISGKSEQEIFEYLWWVETEHMELSGNPQHTKNIAKMLKTVHNERVKNPST